MYSICKAMKWAHLPVAGGLYDQHPAFIDDMSFLMSEDAKAQKREMEAEKRKSQKGGKGRR